MEESSEAHMETDVSSTTDDVPEAPQVARVNSDIETVIEIEIIKEEQDTATGDCSMRTTPSTSTNNSPQKPATPQKLSKTPISSPNITNKVISSSDSENLVSKPSISSKTCPEKQQPESSDKPKIVRTNVTPAKSSDKTDKSPMKVTPVQTALKSPFKELKVSKGPIKLIRIREIPKSNAVSVQDKSPAKEVSRKPDKEVAQLKISNKEVKLPETSGKSVIAPEKSNKQETLLVTTPKKVENLIEQSENVSASTTSRVTEKSPLKEQQSTNMDVDNKTNEKNSNQADSNTVRVPKSSVKMSTDEVSITKTSSVTNQNSNINVPETVNGGNIKESSEPAQESSKQNHSQSSMEIETQSKGISRELKSLINSAKESKIISECNQVTSKTRKSRSQLDTSNTSLNTSAEANKVQGRRLSDASQVSNSSEKSEKGLKRTMRSQNPDFASKCKMYMNAVLSKALKVSSNEATSDDETIKPSENTSMEYSKLTPPSSKKKKVCDPPTTPKQISDNNMSKHSSDAYCWRCHWIIEVDDTDKSHPPVLCSVCPRSFHYKCISGNERKSANEKNWVCPDCLAILNAEGSDTRSVAMKKTSLGMLCDLLKYALERMMDLNGVEPFLQPVDRKLLPDYDKYVVHPMDLSQMKQNITDGLYGSTEAFVADAQWILHNSIIFNTLQSKLTSVARALVRSCRAEMSEIEACPECYAAAHARRPTWFTDVCSTPHLLLWAKLKGFPYWPAKAMSVNSSGLVDVRFFGAHDRAWVPAKDCFLFSERDPNNFRSKRQDILDSMQEAEQHIRNISRKYGKFVYPPFKTLFDPAKHSEQLKSMIPSFDGEVRPPIKDKQVHASPLSKSKRSTSKGSKSSTNDGDGSESEDTSSSSARTDVVKMKKNNNTENTAAEKPPKSVSPVVANQSLEEPIVTRKRRRSNLEEAVMTFIESKSHIPEKKNKADKPEQQEPSSSKEDKAQSQTKETETTVKKKVELQRSKSKDVEPQKSKSKDEEPQKSKSKDEEPSSSTQDTESQRVTPIRLVALPRTNKQTPKMFAATKCTSNPTSPKEDDKTPQKTKASKPEKSSTSEKVKEDKPKKRSSTRANKSLNDSVSKTPKAAEKKTEINANTNDKEIKEKENKKTEIESFTNKVMADQKADKSSKGRVVFDDNTSLAMLARERRRSNANLPTISNVVSLSTLAQATLTTDTPTTSSTHVSKTVAVSSDSSLLTPTSSVPATNMITVPKLQKLRDNTEPVVGRVGVRAFARMTSPNVEKNPENVEVEIKAEPIDMEEDEVRLSEKMDLMTACKLQPVNQTQNLRDVRISRVVGAAKKPEARPRARKTFPQPRPSEGRSELNGKNTMVYIPIQPPATQPPVRPARPNANVQAVRFNAPANGTVNTVVTPLKPTTSRSSTTAPTAGQASVSTGGQASVSTAGQPSVPTAGQASVATAGTTNQVALASLGPVNVPTVASLSKGNTSVNQSMPTVGQMSVSAGQVSVPTVEQGSSTMHSVPVPMVTSVNGQWMFSLQPLLSVGNVDHSPSTPLVNGIAPVSVTAGASAATLTPIPRTNNDKPPNEMPRLQSRPTLLQSLDGCASAVTAPASAGPATARIHENAQRLTEFFRVLIEESISETPAPAAALTALRAQLEQTKWKHVNEIEELKFNHELTLAEMRLTFEKEKIRIVNETRRAAQADLEAAVRQAKSKRWCANCCQEAQFYCCWSTAYCDLPCQRAHWPTHYLHCAQTQQETTSDESGFPEVQILPEIPTLQKSTQPATPALTVGGKVANRVFTPQDNAAGQKTSIIVSMVEDNSGNQTMKCVGTYKPGTSQAPMQPLIINKQMEDAAKKVVTSGGYLIVGAGNSTSIITPGQTRRPNTIQYFT